MALESRRSPIWLSDERFDFATHRAPEYFYIVAATERSGSSYLCAHLWRTGILGAPIEYFNTESVMAQMIRRFGVHSPADYLQRLFEVRTSPNGVFGFKAHWPQFQFAALARFMDWFPGARWIYNDRRDIVAQAVSLVKARQTHQWSTLMDALAVPEYEFETILAAYRQILDHKRDWQAAMTLGNIEPIPVFYEDFIERPEAVVAGIVKDLGFPGEPRADIALPEPERQSDHTNSTWIDRFRAEATEGGIDLKHLAPIRSAVQL